MGGPEIEETQAEQTYRRSLYFHHTPDSQATFLKLFNAPDPTDCYKREESIVPQQALALANSGLSRSQARLVAQTISAEIERLVDNTAFIRAAFENTLGRLPTEKELAESQAFLRQEEKQFRSRKNRRARQDQSNQCRLPARNQVCGPGRIWFTSCLITMIL